MTGRIISYFGQNYLRGEIMINTTSMTTQVNELNKTIILTRDIFRSSVKVTESGDIEEQVNGISRLFFLHSMPSLRKHCKQHVTVVKNRSKFILQTEIMLIFIYH